MKKLTKILSLILCMVLFASYLMDIAAPVSAATLEKPKKPSVSSSIKGYSYVDYGIFGYYEYYSKDYTITWNEISGAEGYEFYYKVNSCSPTIETVDETTYELGVRTFFYLPMCGKIKVKVRAYDIVNGQKVYSKWSSTRTIYY